MCISFTFHCYLDYTKPKDRLDYDRADYHGMRAYLTNSNWAENLMNSSTETNKDQL